MSPIRIVSSIALPNSPRFFSIPLVSSIALSNSPRFFSIPLNGVSGNELRPPSRTHTIKVFSMLDTKSLMQASASCTMFNKCAMDRLCYSHIDLTTAAKDADNGVVCTMIHRAGKEFMPTQLQFPLKLPTPK
ncbi:unnamed protein product [Arabis nemorensis]|uniref:F-box domain-containing protein n=1 Tax=Arabis nemorensis TaxID=586526 RepID=A0A565BLH8_9BRAS|nr:unnamed protein product [Arabis nemorensis]